MRAALIGGSALLVLAMLAALAGGAAAPPIFGALLFGVVLLVGTLLERRTYKPLIDGSPGPGWRMTEERFVDPESGAMVSVYYHDRSGERRYVKLPGAQAGGR
jgi:hypothetical protein